MPDPFRILKAGYYKRNNFDATRREVANFAENTVRVAAIEMQRKAIANASKPGLAHWSQSQHPSIRTGNLVRAIQAQRIGATALNFKYTVFVDKARAPYAIDLETGEWVRGLYSRSSPSATAYSSGYKKDKPFPYPFFGPAYDDTVPFFLQDTSASGFSRYGRDL